MNTSERNVLVENYLPLAESMAFKIARSCPRHVSVDELKSAAYFGLVDASRRYDPTILGAFGPYARKRIWGELVDCVRSVTWGKKGHKKRVTSADFSDESDPHYEDLIGESEAEEQICSAEFFQKLTSNVSSVARDIIFMYHVESLTMKAIGQRVGLSIGRVSQILSASIEQIREGCDEKELMELAA